MHFVWDSMRSVKADACNAGVDIQRDVLDLMGFKPLMPQVKDMDGRCFSK
jgi:acyl CoA:acetate/3-ketoacid CoA transferase